MLKLNRLEKRRSVTRNRGEDMLRKKSRKSRLKKTNFVRQADTKLFTSVLKVKGKKNSK